MNQLYSYLGQFSFLVRLKKLIDKIFYGYYWLQKEALVSFRRMFSYHGTGPTYVFAILCVKRPAYVDLAIRNINSLHFHNPNHICIIFADDMCLNTIKTKAHLFDYPERTKIRPISPGKEPWQYTKVDVLLRASKMGAVLIDADSFWYSSPYIDPKKVTLLVPAYQVGQNKLESQIVRKLFKERNWLSFTHYVTGFVSVPPEFVTDAFKAKLRSYVRRIYTSSLSFLPDETDRQSFHRLAEEMAVSYVVQELVAKNDITTLKTSDGPGDRKIMQSLYYGCSNQITN